MVKCIGYFEISHTKMTNAQIVYAMRFKNHLCELNKIWELYILYSLYSTISIWIDIILRKICLAIYVDTRTIGLKEFSCMTLFQIHLMAFPKTWICIKERFEELYGWNWNIVTGSGMFAHSNVLIIINCVIKHDGSMLSSFIEKKRFIVG